MLFSCFFNAFFGTFRASTHVFFHLGCILRASEEKKSSIRYEKIVANNDYEKLNRNYKDTDSSMNFGDAE